jgi:DtxR family transcriptional regulator, Mn-dependent transcriptional regulator
VATSTVENYLKRLYQEEHAPAPRGGQMVSMGRLATIMGVVPGTATAMVKALSDSGLVRYSPRAGVQLTPGGTQLALHVLRRHRLVELFLVRIVGLDWSEVHDEAEELEHVISDKLLDRIDALLGHPTVDPHGDPIPTSAGDVAPSDAHSLATCPLEVTVEVTRVLDQETRFLQFVDQCGLTPGARWRVTARNTQAESVTAHRAQQEQGGPQVLSLVAAGKFLVKEIP